MPFCPKCRYEYKPETTVCPDCDESLVNELPEKEEKNVEEGLSKYENWIQLARLTSQPTVAMLVEILESKNIPAVILSGAGHFGITGQLGMSSSRPIDGAYSLMVPEEYVVDADREASIIIGDDWEKYRLVDIE